MPPSMKQIGITEFALIAIVIAIAVFQFAACDGEESDTDSINTSACEQACSDFDICFGFEGTGETLNTCLAACDESTEEENQCLDACAPIADCDEWQECAGGC